MNGYRIYIIHKDSDLGTVRSGDGSGDNLWPGNSPLDAVERLVNRYTWYHRDQFYVGHLPGQDVLDFIRVRIVPSQVGPRTLAAVFVNPKRVD